MRSPRTQRHFKPGAFGRCDDLETRQVLSQLGASALFARANRLLGWANRLANSRRGPAFAPVIRALTSRAITLNPALAIPINAGLVTRTPTMDQIKDGPLANLGQDLINVYDAFQNGATSADLASQFPQVEFQGDKVGVNVRVSGDINLALASLTNLGMDVQESSEAYATVSGFVPVSALPSVAALPQTVSGQPRYAPITNPTDANAFGVRSDAVRPFLRFRAGPMGPGRFHG